MNEAKQNECVMEPMVLRWWPIGVFSAVFTAWIAWCFYDGLAGIFAPAVAMFWCVCVFGCGPTWKKNAKPMGDYER
jgi:hypothetical protein